MATSQEKQELMEILKFTPITVQVLIQGYGGESYAGILDREIYDYFKEHKIDLEEFTNDWDDENFKFVPDNMRPFSPGSAYECDNLWHASGAEIDGSNVITISGPDGDIWEHSLDYLALEESGVTIVESGGCDLDDDDIPDNKVVFNGGQGEKGCFFDGELLLKAPFDPKKLTIHYENCGGWYLVTFVEYDGEEIDGSGGYSTTGKWSENKWILKGDEEVYDPVSIEDREEGVDYTQYPTEEEIDELDKIAESDKTDWFPKDINPVHKGEYEVVYDAKWPLSGIGFAEWTGRTWKQDGKKLAIVKWRGLAEKPEGV